MKNWLYAIMLLGLFSCSEVEDDERYLIKTRVHDSFNEPISDINLVTIRSSNFFSPEVLLGKGLSDIDGNIEFVSLVPTGSSLNMSINPRFNNFGIEGQSTYSSINLSINKDLLSDERAVDLGTLNLKSQIPFTFTIQKTSAGPAVISWELIYRSSSFCAFNISSFDDFDQDFSCEITQNINRTNDSNNPNEELNISVDENTIITFLYSINEEENQILEITPNLNNNEFEFNY